MIRTRHSKAESCGSGQEANPAILPTWYDPCPGTGALGSRIRSCRLCAGRARVAVHRRSLRCSAAQSESKRERGRYPHLVESLIEAGAAQGTFGKDRGVRLSALARSR